MLSLIQMNYSYNLELFAANYQVYFVFISKEACATCILGNQTKCILSKIYDIVEKKSVSFQGIGFYKYQFQKTLRQECHMKLWQMYVDSNYSHTLFKTEAA